jgi:hypothetical protein
MSGFLQFDWDAPVSDEQRDALLEKIAHEVRLRGLETPVVWFLEIHKPLAPLGGQLAVALSPYIATLLSGGAFDLQRARKVLQDVANIDRLIERIENGEHRAPEAAAAS